MSRQCVGIHTFFSTKTEGFAKLGVLFRTLWLLCCFRVVYLTKHRIIPSPPWFDHKAHTQVYSQASLLPAPTAREQKKRETKEMRLADTHHKTDLQLSVTKRRVSCVQNLTYFTHSPRLLSTWQH